MRLFTTTLVALTLVASCKTTDPPRKETFEDDEVVVSDPVEPREAPDAGVGTSTADARVPEPPSDEAPPQTFVPEPQLPDDMSFQETALARTVQQLRSPLRLTPILEGGCGIPSAIRAAAAAQSSGYTVDSCLRAVTAAHAMTYHRTVTKVGVIDVSTVELRHDGEALWTLAADCTDLRQRDDVCASDFISRRPTVMSFVGPILTYHIASHVALVGAAPQVTNVGFVVDVRTHLPAKFGALVDLDSLRDGLKRHIEMRRKLNPAKLDAAKTVDEIWALWRTQDFAYFGGYYFAAWDADNGLADMRIWYLEEQSDPDPMLKELSVWVRPQPSWKSAFADAATEKSGFFAR